jgi:hypothetical protein
VKGTGRVASEYFRESRDGLTPVVSFTPSLDGGPASRGDRAKRVLSLGPAQKELSSLDRNSHLRCTGFDLCASHG